MQRRERAGGDSRFIAVVHDRSPLAAFVAVDSPLKRAEDLGGNRVAASAAAWFDREYQAALRRLGLAPAVHVAPSAPGERPSMVRGEVEVIGSWAEAVAVIRRRAQTAVRAIPLGSDIYNTGLVAADHLDSDIVGRMAAAFSDALQHQRQNPDAGLAELCRHHPDVDADAVREEWSVLSGYLGPRRPGVMDRARWQATIEHLRQIHGFSHVTVADLIREGLVGESVLTRASA